MKKLILALILMAGSLLAQAQTAVVPAGSGTSNDPYQIATLSNLYWLSKDTTIWGQNLYYIQTADIDASDTKNWDVSGGIPSGFSPIGFYTSSNVLTYFKGHYNGNGHNISNLYINRPGYYYVGLFGYVFGSTINSLNITNAYIRGDGYIAALGGYIGKYSSVYNCTSSGIIAGDSLCNYSAGLVGYQYYHTRISNCSSSATVSGYDYVGGLIGRSLNNDTVDYCYSTGTVKGYYSYIGGLIGDFGESGTVLTNCYSTGDVSGTKNVGGLVGRLAVEQATNCYSTSNVSATNDYVGGLVGTGGFVENCHSTGNVTGRSYLGGLIGIGNAQYCYSTGNVTAITKSSRYVGGFIGTGTATECYSTGNALGGLDVGGFVGEGNAINCYCTGNATADSILFVGNYSRCVGGFVGNNTSLTNSYCIGTASYDKTTTSIGALVGQNAASYIITNSYWNKDISNQTTGIAIDKDTTTLSSATGLTSAQMKQSANFKAWNFDTIWTIRTDSTYPMLRKVNNAPIASPDSLSGDTINFKKLLVNDVDYKTGQTALTYKIISGTTHYGSLTDSTFTFGTSSTDSLKAATLVAEGSADTLTYRVGRVIAAGDTLWGNQTTAKLVYVADVATTVANATPAAALSLSPNPAADAFTVTGLAGSASILVTDVSGKTLISKTINQGKTITLSSLPTGVYLVKINTPNGVVQKKLIKK